MDFDNEIKKLHKQIDDVKKIYKDAGIEQYAMPAILHYQKQIIESMNNQIDNIGFNNLGVEGNLDAQIECFKIREDIKKRREVSESGKINGRAKEKSFNRNQGLPER